MAKQLPPAVTADSPQGAIAARMDEERRRKNLNDPTVAQEVLDLLEEIDARKGSSSEIWEVYGYSPRHALIPAWNEQARIIRELGQKPSKEITSSILVVKDVMTKHDISEFVPKPEPIPE